MFLKKTLLATFVVWLLLLITAHLFTTVHLVKKIFFYSLTISLIVLWVALVFWSIKSVKQAYNNQDSKKKMLFIGIFLLLTVPVLIVGIWISVAVLLAHTYSFPIMSTPQISLKTSMLTAECSLFVPRDSMFWYVRGCESPHTVDREQIIEQVRTRHTNILTHCSFICDEIASPNHERTLNEDNHKGFCNDLSRHLELNISCDDVFNCPGVSCS